MYSTEVKIATGLLSFDIAKSKQQVHNSLFILLRALLQLVILSVTFLKKYNVHDSFTANMVSIWDQDKFLLSSKWS